MSDDRALQFDRAVFDSASSAATPCASCRQPIVQSYYDINGRIICSRCREALTEGSDGSRMARAGKALAAGLGAAILGAVLWWGVRKLTGYEVGIISIGIGIAVGKAVRWGSQNRGGWAYQLAAILLTYAAVAGNYVPDVVQAFRQEAQKQEAPAAAPATVAKASVAPAKPAPAREQKLSAGEVLLGLLSVFFVAAALPFLQGANNIIGILIIGFGLFEAWKINKRVPLTITGPFSVAPAAPGPPPTNV